MDKSPRDDIVNLGGNFDVVAGFRSYAFDEQGRCAYRADGCADRACRTGDTAHRYRRRPALRGDPLRRGQDRDRAGRRSTGPGLSPAGDLDRRDRSAARGGRPEGPCRHGDQLSGERRRFTNRQQLARPARPERGGPPASLPAGRLAVAEARTDATPPCGRAARGPSPSSPPSLARRR